MRLTLRTLLAYLDDMLDPAETKRIGQKVAGGIGDLRQRAHFVEHLLRPFDQLGDVGILQRVLKAAAAGAGTGR